MRLQHIQYQWLRQIGEHLNRWHIVTQTRYNYYGQKCTILLFFLFAQIKASFGNRPTYIFPNPNPYGCVFGWYFTWLRAAQLPWQGNKIASGKALIWKPKQCDIITINLQAIVAIGWTISIGSMLAIVFGIYPINQPSNETTPLESSFHESFSRVSWAIALSWIIFACTMDYGGPVNCFLASPLWQPLSRLSYSLYIVHLPIQLYLIALTKTPTYFSDLNAVHILYSLICLNETVVWNRNGHNLIYFRYSNFGEISDFHCVLPFCGR